MVKKRASLLGSMLRVGRAQQRSAARLVGSLLAPPHAPARRKAAGAGSSPSKPPPPPLPGKWLAARLPAAAGAMRYWLYLPSRGAADAVGAADMHTGSGIGVGKDSGMTSSGLPLVVMLHGCEQSATSFADGSRMNRLAEKAGYAVLYPQQSIGAHPQRCWKWYDRATQQGGGDVERIVAVIGAVLAAYPIDRQRIYIGGLSAGAAMAHIVALNHPGLFAGLGLHSGPVFGAGHSGVGALGVMQHGAAARAGEAMTELLLRRPHGGPLPTIVIHGDDDAVVRPVNQLQLAGQALHLNHPGHASLLAQRETLKPATSRSRAYRVRDITRGRKLLLRVVSIAGLGHAWSGGDARFKFNAAGGPDASRMMLDFFARQRAPLPAPR